MLVSVLLGSALAGSGCVGSLEPVDPIGDPDPDPDGDGVARQMFTDDVAPMLQAACAGCHAGAPTLTPLKFLGNSGVTGYYTAVTMEEAVISDFDPALAELLRHGLHDGGSARAWTTAEAATITSWMSMEATERGL